MQQKIFLIAFQLLLFSFHLYSQEISGRVVNTSFEPIESVVVVLQNKDSVFVSACVTDTLGVFNFKNTPIPYILVLQQLSYKTKTISSDNSELGDIILEDDPLQIKHAVVHGYSPIMNVSESGALTFSSEKLRDTRPISNALDLLKEIPCIESNGNKFWIIGTSNTVITINGKESKMSSEQLSAFLSSLPAENIKSIDLYFKSPAKTGINGASINFNLEKKRAENMQLSGLVSLSAIQAHYNTPSGQAYASLFKDNLSFEVGVEKSWDHDYLKLNLDSEHLLDDKTYFINQHTSQNQHSNTNHVFGNFDFDISENSNLNIHYAGAYNRNTNDAIALTSLSATEYSSTNRLTGYNNMSDISVDYTYNDLETGGEVLFYNQSQDQFLENNQSNNSLSSNTKQKYIIFKGYIHHDISIVKINDISYGMDFGWSESQNSYDGIWDKDLLNNDSFNSKQRETSVSIFAEWNHIITQKGRFSVSIKTEYSKSKLENMENVKTLWEGVDLYPSISFMYKIIKTNFLQIALSSKKTYPPYWQTTTGRTYLNQYCVIESNPLLSPYISYQLNMNYIMQKKFVIGIFAEMVPDYIVQLLYQDPKELTAKYRYYNLDNSTKLGVLAVIPYSCCWCDNNLTVNAFYMRQKGEFEESSFNRGTIGGRISNNFNIFLKKDKSIIAQVSGWYQLPAIQGIYTIKSMSNISASLTWHPIQTNLSIIVKANDIFNTHRMKVDANDCLQNYQFKNYLDSRYFGITIKYIINNHKNKTSRTIDTGRLGGINN